MNKPADEQIRKQAEDQYASDTHAEHQVSIDQDAAISHGEDGGAWVAAWVWVDYDDEA